MSKIAKIGFQEVGVEILNSAECLNADDLEALVCKEAGACGDKKNECPKSKGDLGTLLGSIAGLAKANASAAEAKNREEAPPPSKHEDSNNQKPFLDDIKNLQIAGGGHGSGGTDPIAVKDAIEGGPPRKERKKTTPDLLKNPGSSGSLPFPKPGKPAGKKKCGKGKGILTKIFCVIKKVVKHIKKAFLI